MQDFLHYLVTSILQHEDVAVDKQESEFDIEFTIAIPGNDVGLIIGKRGCVIKSLRQITALKLPSDMRKRLHIKVIPKRIS